MFQRSFVTVLLFAVFGLSALHVCAQETDELNPVKWSIKPIPSHTFAKWNQFKVELHAAIDRGWRLYSTEKVEGGPSPTRISIVPGHDFEIAGEIDSPAPYSAYDPNYQVTTEFYEAEVVFTVPVKSITARSGESVRLQVRYQTCSPTICLPPKLLEFEARLEGVEAKPDSAIRLKTTAKNADIPGTIVADFDFIDFTGKSHRFSEFRGRVVLLDFWASWCGPCLADIPQLKKIYQKYHAQGLDIVGMDSETLGQKDIDAEFARDSQAKAREIVSTRGVSWPQATAESSQPIASAMFGIQNLPAKILIDKNGKIVARLKDLAELDQLLPKLLEEK